MIPSDFLFLEPLLQAHLRDALEQRIYVRTAAELASVTEATQPTPAVHLLYRGYRPGNIETPGFAEIEQTWLTVVAVRNVRDTLGGAAARSEAGPIAGAVLAAMHRARFKHVKPLRLAPAPQAGFSAGHFYLPLAWTAPITFRSDT